MLRPLDPYCSAAGELLAASDAYMGALYPAESNHLEPAANLARPGVLFLGAWQAQRLLGCGAVRQCRHDTDYGEIKRMFVWPDARGLGAGHDLLAALEDHLRDSGIALARLEMGIFQPEASALYARAGYVLRTPFGEYREDPLSVFLEKRL